MHEREKGVDRRFSLIINIVFAQNAMNCCLRMIGVTGSSPLRYIHVYIFILISAI